MKQLYGDGNIMNSKKLFRDILILVVVLTVVVIFISRNKSIQGPVESVLNNNIESGHEFSTEDVGAMHGKPMVTMTDGEPVIYLGSDYVGEDWIQSKINEHLSGAPRQGHDMEALRQSALQQPLLNAAGVLIENAARLEWNLSVTDTDIAEREAEFLSQFNTEEEGMELMNEMGVSMERMHNMWREEIEQTLLIDHIAEMESLEPGSSEAVVAYETWLLNKIKTTDFTFTDPEREILFIKLIESMDNVEVSDTPMGMPPGHGMMNDDIGTEEDQ